MGVRKRWRSQNEEFKQVSRMALDEKISLAKVSEGYLQLFFSERSTPGETEPVGAPGHNNQTIP